MRVTAIFPIVRPCLNYPPLGFTPYGPNRVDRVLNKGIGEKVVDRYRQITENQE